MLDFKHKHMSAESDDLTCWWVIAGRLLFITHPRLTNDARHTDTQTGGQEGKQVRREGEGKEAA
ncbi:hypothetical protein E2C01_074169 [Portunus trituberculatus]|uniref:Uncharacterized protein n=1 Tax=Portunus trituberculatus TaxID=210409 RepID=A0A5B7I7C7_PORTR|nr:hypothetical protein [Portunus trituberculatus]